jgi:hypothetical protein
MGDEEGAPLGEEGRTTWRGNSCQVWECGCHLSPKLPRVDTSRDELDSCCHLSIVSGFHMWVRHLSQGGRTSLLAHA